jgi:hypothetical protein
MHPKPISFNSGQVFTIASCPTDITEAVVKVLNINSRAKNPAYSLKKNPDRRYLNGYILSLRSTSTDGKYTESSVLVLVDGVIDSNVVYNFGLINL